MKKRTFDHLIPPWTDARTHRTFFLFCVGGALILSLCLYLPQLDMARTGLYYNGVAGEVHRLYPDIRMPYFADLVSSQEHVSNFYSQPVFSPWSCCSWGRWRWRGTTMPIFAGGPRATT